MVGATATGFGLSNSERVAVALNLGDFEWAMVGLRERGFERMDGFE
jgi:hypothetical protein